MVAPILVLLLVFAAGAPQVGHAQQYPEIIELWPAPCRHGAISGDMEYLGCGPFLIVVDISVPDAPVVVNHLILESICDLETSGSYLYVSSNGLHVFDISDPASPVEVGASWVPCGYSIDVSTPLVVSVDRYLEGPARIFDVSDPTYPAQVGSWGSAAYRYREVGVQGQYAYVAFNWYDDILEWGCLLYVVDVSVPSSPLLVGHWSGGNCDLGEIDLAGQYAYVAGQYAYVADSERGLTAFDISNPTSPQRVDYTNDVYADGVVVQGDYAYVNGMAATSPYESGLHIYDVSTPGNIQGTGYYPLPEGVGDVDLRGDFAHYAYIGGLKVIDVSDPEVPFEVGSLDWAGPAEDVVVRGDFAYVLGAQLRVIDISDPSAARVVGQLYQFRGRSVAVSGDFAYVAGKGPWPMLRVIDISVPTAPVQVGELSGISLADPDLVVSDDLAFVAADSYGLRVIDVSTPTSPTEIGSCSTGPNAVGVAVSGAFAYVADESVGLRVIDVSTSTSPYVIATVAIPGTTLSCAASDGLAYVVGSSGLTVIDVSSPGTPSVIGSCAVPDQGLDLWLAAGRVYVATETGLAVVDVSDPSTPVLIGTDSTLPALSVAWSRGVAITVGNSGTAFLRTGQLFFDGFESGDLTVWSAAVP